MPPKARKGVRRGSQRERERLAKEKAMAMASSGAKSLAVLSQDALQREVEEAQALLARAEEEEAAARERESRRTRQGGGGDRLAVSPKFGRRYKGRDGRDRGPWISQSRQRAWYLRSRQREEAAEPGDGRRSPVARLGLPPKDAGNRHGRNFDEAGLATIRAAFESEFKEEERQEIDERRAQLGSSSVTTRDRVAAAVDPRQNEELALQWHDGSGSFWDRWLVSTPPENDEFSDVRRMAERDEAVNVDDILAAADLGLRAGGAAYAAADSPDERRMLLRRERDLARGMSSSAALRESPSRQRQRVPQPTPTPLRAPPTRSRIHSRIGGDRAQTPDGITVRTETGVSLDELFAPMEMGEAASAAGSPRRLSLAMEDLPQLVEANADTELSLMPLCHECDVSDAALGCVDCQLLLCQRCWDDVHQRYELRKHVPRAVPPTSKRFAKKRVKEERERRTKEMRHRQQQLRQERARRQRELQKRGGLRRERERARKEQSALEEAQKRVEEERRAEEAKLADLHAVAPHVERTELGEVPDERRPKDRLMTGDKTKIWDRAVVGTAGMQRAVSLPRLEFFDTFRAVSRYGDNERAVTSTTDLLREPEEPPAHVPRARSPEQRRWQQGAQRRESDDEDEDGEGDAAAATGWRAQKEAEERAKREAARQAAAERRERRAAAERAAEAERQRLLELERQAAEDARDSPRHAFCQTVVEQRLLPEATMLRAAEGVAKLAHFGLGPAKVLALAATMASFSALRELDLTDNRLDDAACAGVLRHVRAIETLRKLDLSESGFAAQGAAALGALLVDQQQRACPLEVLALRSCSLRDATLGALVPALSQNKTVLSLDLSSNELSAAGAAHLARVLRDNGRLQVLKLSWNRLACAGARALVGGLAAASQLRRFEASHNGLTDLGAQHICAALERHSTLQHVDLSSNMLGPKACMVLAYAVRTNSNLKSVVVRDNPVGPFGGRAILRTLEAAHVSGKHVCEVDTMGCDMRGTAINEDDEERVFDPEEPADSYTLDLEDPYQRTIALELLHLYRTKEGFELTNATLRGNPANLRRGHWVPPVQGELAFQVCHFRRSATAKDVLHEKSMSHMLNKLTGWVRAGVRLGGAASRSKKAAAAAKARLRKRRKQKKEEGIPEGEEAEDDDDDDDDDEDELTKIEIGDDERLTELQIGVGDLYFDTDRAQQLLDSFLSPEGKLKALVMLVPRLVDHDMVPEFVDRNLTSTQREEFGQEIGFLYNFDPLNATGRYQLELVNPLQRLVAIRLLEISNDEAYEGRVVIQREDTSQYNNWTNWRNVYLDDNLMIPSRSWVVPRRGRLQVDYVSTSRPPVGVDTVSAEELEDILAEIGLGPDSELRCAPPAEKEARVVLNEHNHSKLVVCLPSCPMFTEEDVVVRNRRLGWRVPLKGNSKRYAEIIQALRLLIRERGYYFSAEQVSRIVLSFPAVRKQSDHIYKPRVEALLAVLSRLTDLTNFQDISVMLTDEEEQAVVHRVGWLNLFNPMRPDLFFKLNMSKPDHYNVARMLIRLAVVEPGENWIDETYDGYPFELPLSWVTEPPRYGTLTCTYSSDPAEDCAPVWGLRLELMRRCLVAEPPPPEPEPVNDAYAVREGKWQFAKQYGLPLPERPERSSSS